MNHATNDMKLCNSLEKRQKSHRNKPFAYGTIRLNKVDHITNAISTQKYKLAPNRRSYEKTWLWNNEITFVKP